MGSRNHSLMTTETICVCIGSVYNIVVDRLRSTAQGYQDVIGCQEVARAEFAYIHEL